MSNRRKIITEPHKTKATVALMQSIVDGDPTKPVAIKIILKDVEEGAARLQVSIVDKKGVELIEVHDRWIDVDASLTLEDFDKVFTVSIFAGKP